ncbi:hypothetical protein [Devosia sp. Leaf420]|uniref:hypothetical protein n=1 Tax=Devosia sp. Leaf420 TaxID=1736374 RepID=UPI000B1FFD49|nr:hypothetical protein [Devosia sp. Leaf420]
MRQAFVLVHGMCEQKPMQNLRSFVDAVWKRNPKAHHPHATAGAWSHPDDVQGGFELRRISTSSNSAGVLTDFYEFYWAHLMQGNQLSHVQSWIFALLRRNPFSLSETFRLAWFVIAISGVAFVGLGTLAGMAAVGRSPLPVWITLVLTILVWPTAEGLLRLFVGDVARYLQPSPENIKVRHDIREAGVKLIDALHERGYHRITIVGHSLGCVVGYDILTHAWARRHKSFAGDAKAQEQAAQVLEEIIATEPFDTNAYRAAQRSYSDALVEAGLNWRITDFVTLGNPMAHADVLLALDDEDFAKRCQERELPTSPPALERRGAKTTFRYSRSFQSVDGGTARASIPHHAAVFAPVVWTNLYFPSRWLVQGDSIGGELWPLFGRGVHDVPVRTELRGGLLLHTEYWTFEAIDRPGSHVETLCQALDVGRAVK